MTAHLRLVTTIRFVCSSLLLSVALLAFLLGSLAWQHDQVTRFFSPFIFVLAGGLVLYGAGGLLVAFGLRERRPWGRTLAIVASLMELTGFPIGTALGGYTLWVLLQPEGARLFSEAPVAPALPPLPKAPPRQLKWD